MESTGRPWFAGIAQNPGRLVIVVGYAGIEAGIDAGDKAGVGNGLGWRLCQHNAPQEGPGRAEKTVNSI